MDSAMRLRGTSTSSTFTLTMSPGLATARGSLTKVLDMAETCTSPLGVASAGLIDPIEAWINQVTAVHAYWPEALDALSDVLQYDAVSLEGLWWGKSGE